MGISISAGAFHLCQNPSYPDTRTDFARMMPKSMRRGASTVRRLPALACAAALALVAVGPAPAAEPPLVAAAASLRHVLPALSRAWVDAGGVRPEVSFGSSGNLYRQIAQGAPFELFLSADEEQALKLVAAGRTDGEGIVYGLGRLVLLVPRHSRLALDPTLADLSRALDDGRLRRLAIANPAHAPYGRAAREALVRAALWPRLGDRLLLAENAAQAVQFALARAADGGIVPWALVLSERVSRDAGHALLDAAMHDPIAHRMVLLARAGTQARALFRFLAGPEAGDIFERFGFGAPRAHGPFPSRSVSLAPRRWPREHLRACGPLAGGTPALPEGHVSTVARGGPSFGTTGNRRKPAINGSSRVAHNRESAGAEHGCPVT